MPWILLEKSQDSISAGKVLMATVKGDVHDIGKNIVGVVLACNNYEVIDLGVMVPATKILETALKEKVDIIGLSGLITPSLDEMVHVAAEMQGRGFAIPLLIGGATTSEMHTAVKIAPEYRNAVIHVRDASRAVGVVAALLAENKQEFCEEVNSRYLRLVEKYHASRQEKNLISLNQARLNKTDIDWKNYIPPVPEFLGIKVFDDYPIEDLIPYIDWTFFFHAWKINGKYPDIFNDPQKGEEALKLFKDAQDFLQKIIKNKMIQAKGVFGIFPASATGDSIELFDVDNKKKPLASFHFLRNQEQKEDGIPNASLADFIAPAQSGITDFMGAFAVTAGHGIEKWVEEFEKDHDHYSSIMLKILADRLAEAFAEQLHLRIRREFWGYAKDENLTLAEILKEQYLGIRPAPGYPACPEHSEKEVLFQLLRATQNAGITLTESFAMYPAASVSGYYFSHPESRYFNLGKIQKDQVQDYAKRKNISLGQAELFLTPNLMYK